MSYPKLNAAGDPAFKGSNPCYQCGVDCSSTDCEIGYGDNVEIVFTWDGHACRLGLLLSESPACDWTSDGQCESVSVHLWRSSTCPCTWCLMFSWPSGSETVCVNAYGDGNMWNVTWPDFALATGISFELNPP